MATKEHAKLIHMAETRGVLVIKPRNGLIRFDGFVVVDRVSHLQLLGHTPFASATAFEVRCLLDKLPSIKPHDPDRPSATTLDVALAASAARRAKLKKLFAAKGFKTPGGPRADKKVRAASAAEHA